MQSPKEQLQSQLLDSIEYISESIQLIQNYGQGMFDYQPSENSRSMGELLLHIIRSQEFYLQGVATNHFEPLKYNLTTFGTPQQLAELYKRVAERTKKLVRNLSGDLLHTKFDQLENPTFGLNLMIELLYHQSNHIGQIQAYLRLNDINPPEYKYLI